MHNRFLRNTATVEFVEFGDVTSPQSRADHKLIGAFIDLFKGHVSYHYRHYPDPDSNQSLLAAMALEAARQQAQFHPMYKALLTHSTIDCATVLADAYTLGLDQQQFMHDLADDRVNGLIKADWQNGYELGVRKTPALFVGGHRFHGKLTLSRLTSLVRFQMGRFSDPEKCFQPVTYPVGVLRG
jgi:protein-disulfide isomerase